MNVLKEINKDWIKEGNKQYEYCFFDFEVFAEYWLVVFHRESRGTITVTSDDSNYRSKIIDMIKGTILVGYNIKHYDMKILHAILSGGYSSDAIKELSDNIITAKRDDKKLPYNDYYYWNKFMFIDLFDDTFGSLKEFESNRGISVEESSVEFDKIGLTQEDKLDIESYCCSDVLATRELFISRLSYVSSKITLANMYNIPLDKAIKATNAKLVAIILNPLDTNVDGELFELPENVEEYVKEWVPEDVVNFYLTTPMDEIESFDKVIFDNIVTLGLGGIHSVISKDSVMVESDDDFGLYNIDVTSYYPNMMIHYDYLSRRVVKDREQYAGIYEQRLQAKKEMKKHPKGSEEHNKYKAIQGALKLILNTTYGAMKNKYNKLFDFYNASNICILGQLLLAALANELYTKLNCQIIQTNTDGILMYIDNEKLSQAEEIVSKWEKITRLPMEWENVESFVQRDVNNYIEVKEGVFEKREDKIKLKGKLSNQAFEVNSNLNAPITHLAIVNYYVENIDIEDTIKSCKDIKDFCFTTKTGSSYKKTYHYINGEKIKVNKVNRVIATTDKKYGTLKKYKVDDNGKERYDKQAEISEHSKLLNNDLSTYNFEDLEIDYDFYINFAKNKLLDLKNVTLEKNCPFS